MCPDCGAPTEEAAAGADSPVHGELAQANLLRLRGDLDGSEKALLSVLRRFPNNPLAHQMLGEVCAERGEMDRAVEWFELALDLAPNSVEAKRRLDDARERLSARETADTAETLGLPSATPKMAWAPVAFAGALVVLALAIALWPRPSAPRPLQASVAAPVAPVTPAPTIPETTTVNPPVDSTPATLNSTGTQEERKLLEDLRAQAGSVRVQSATLDPRTQTLAVAFEVNETDDLKAVAIAIGKAALGVAPTAMTASLHALRADRLVFAADLPRASMANPEPLTYLWPAENARTTGNPTTQAAPAGAAAMPGGTTPPVGTSPANSTSEGGATTNPATASGTGSTATTSATTAGRP